MKRAMLLIALLTAAPASAQTEAPSLFFTPAERQTIEQAARAQATDPAARHLLYVSSILYFAPDRWSVWIQGRRFGPDTRENGLTIRQVSPDAVTLDCSMADGAKRTATLRTHQSLNLLTGEVIEGY